MARFQVLLLVLVGVVGCEKNGEAPNGEADKPTSVILLCPATSADSLRCPGSGDIVKDWLTRADGTPGSSFRLMSIGQDRDSPKLEVVITIPDHWGNGVRRARREFQSKALRLVQDAPHSTAKDRVLGPPPAVRSIGPAKILVRGLDPDLDWNVGGPAVAMVVVCDRSSSGREISCPRDLITRLYERWMESTKAARSATFEVLVIGTRRSTTKEIFKVTVPNKTDVAARVGHVLGAAQELQRVKLDTEANGSAIAEAISVAADRLQGRQLPHRVLLVGSDLRQHSPRLRFGSRIPKPARFVRALKNAGLTTDLSGVEVFACGRHHLDGMSATGSGQLLRSWQAAFKMMKSKSVNFLHDCGDFKLAVRNNVAETVEGKQHVR